MILFVGDKPSPRMKPGSGAFIGAVCEARLMEWIKKLDIKEFIIMNQVDLVPEIWQVKNKLYTVIALGNNASKALKNTEHFKLPHPSFRNRLLNDPNYIKQKLKECKEYLRSKR